MITNRNMLGAQKVKLHGMTSSKWTTRDKITQYKGLINLYNRDKKLIEVDTLMQQKMQGREIKMIQKEIDQNRKDLDNATRGDKQKLRNTLAEHREMQLAFQNSQPENVIEQIHQLNFNKRKTRDMLLYRVKLKSEQLIDLKLKNALYEDRLKLELLDWQSMIPSEKAAHMITGKVQDAILKKEAAIYIRESYQQIIAIMKKDALYFDAILITLHQDGLEQGKCMINATKLGQLGTEYLDDRRQEFEILDTMIKQDLISRRKDLKTIQENVDRFAENLKNLLRRDSDINVGTVQLPDSESLENLKAEFQTIKTTLDFLKDSIFTPTIEAIYPCIQEQRRQKDRLKEFVEKCEKNRDELLKRSKHASVVNTKLKSTMLDSTNIYVNEKQDLKKAITEEEKEIKELNKLITNRHLLMANVGGALKHLQSTAQLLNKPKGQVTVKKVKVETTTLSEDMETNSIKIIPELISNFAKLASEVKEFPTGEEMQKGYKMFEHMMNVRCNQIPIDRILSEESVNEPMFTTAHILTREDIKKQSEEIVSANAISDDLQMMPTTKKKYTFKKK